MPDEDQPSYTKVSLVAHTCRSFVWVQVPQLFIPACSWQCNSYARWMPTSWPRYWRFGYRARSFLRLRVLHSHKSIWRLELGRLSAVSVWVLHTGCLQNKSIEPRTAIPTSPCGFTSVLFNNQGDGHGRISFYVSSKLKLIMPCRFEDRDILYGWHKMKPWEVDLSTCNALSQADPEPPSQIRQLWLGLSQLNHLCVSFQDVSML